jgi:hypothetical protein
VAMDSEVKEKWPAMDPYKVRIKMWKKGKVEESPLSFSGDIGISKLAHY